MNPKHVVNDKSAGALLFGRDAMKMPCMPMCWRFKCRPRGIWREVRGEVSMPILYVSVHIQAMDSIKAVQWVVSC